jgi:hypothetical protein
VVLEEGIEIKWTEKVRNEEVYRKSDKKGLSGAPYAKEEQGGLTTL